MRLNIISLLLFLCSFGLALSSSAMPFNANGNYEVQEKITLAVDLALNKSITSHEGFEQALTQVVFRNDAEKLLVSFGKGVIAHYREQYSEAITLLLEAEQFAKKLPEPLSFQEAFFRFHIVLSDSYVAIGDYGNGFLHKRAYLKKLGHQHDEKDEALLHALEEKYQIDNKLKENQLLIKNNELKKLEIKRVEQLKESKERNVIILIIVCVLFALMIVRQLRIRKKLLWLAEKDPLTKLINRETLFQRGKELTGQIQTSGDYFSIIMFDLDHFKKINDTHGHLTGDAALKQVASLGLEVMRSRDVLSRLSGEEFVALLPHATPEEAQTIALRLKDKIEQSDFYNPDKHAQSNLIKLTASFGIATLDQTTPNFDVLLRCADKALYQAKANGRNQVANYS